MYSKTRNTLTALIAASLFVAGGWMFGHPVDSDFPSLEQANASVSHLDQPIPPVSITGAGPRITLDSTALRARHAGRMTVAMPYYSFALPTSQRRTD